MLLDFIKEYLLIAKKKLYGITCKTPPNKWNHGTKYDVILVQGFNETFKFLETIAEELNNIGYKVHAFQNINTHDKVSSIAKVFQDYIRRNRLTNLVFIGHSKGGTIIKYLLENNNRIRQDTNLAITIATPHKGSIFGVLRIASLYEIKPNSVFLRNLYSKRQANHLIVNIYPTKDNHVIPNSSLYLDGAKENIKVDVVGHTNILEDKQTIQIINNLVEKQYKRNT